MRRYLVQFDTEVGTHYFAGMKNGVPNFTASRKGAVRFNKKRECEEAIKLSHRLYSKIVKEVN